MAIDVESSAVVTEAGLPSGQVEVSSDLLPFDIPSSAITGPATGVDLEISWAVQLPDPGGSSVDGSIEVTTAR